MTSSSKKLITTRLNNENNKKIKDGYKFITNETYITHSEGMDKNFNGSYRTSVATKDILLFIDKEAFAYVVKKLKSHTDDKFLEEIANEYEINTRSDYHHLKTKYLLNVQNKPGTDEEKLLAFKRSYACQKLTQEFLNDLPLSRSDGRAKEAVQMVLLTYNPDIKNRDDITNPAKKQFFQELAEYLHQKIQNKPDEDKKAEDNRKAAEIRRKEQEKIAEFQRQVAEEQRLEAERQEKIRIITDKVKSESLADNLSTLSKEMKVLAFRANLSPQFRDQILTKSTILDRLSNDAELNSEATVQEARNHLAEETSFLSLVNDEDFKIRLNAINEKIASLSNKKTTGDKIPGQAKSVTGKVLNPSVLSHLKELEIKLAAGVTEKDERLENKNKLSRFFGRIFQAHKYYALDVLTVIRKLQVLIGASMQNRNKVPAAYNSQTYFSAAELTAIRNDRELKLEIKALKNSGFITQEMYSIIHAPIPKKPMSFLDHIFPNRKSF